MVQEGWENWTCFVHTHPTLHIRLRNISCAFQHPKCSDSHGNFIQILLDILLPDHASWLDLYVPNTSLKPVLWTKRLRSKFQRASLPSGHSPNSTAHAAAPSAWTPLCIPHTDKVIHEGRSCRRALQGHREPRESALTPPCKATYFSSVHGGSSEDTEDPVSQPVLQICGLTCTGHQLLTSPRSRNSLCMISNEPARYSNCRIPKGLFLLIPRLQPSFNSCTSSSLTPLAHSQITSNSSPDLWSTDFGCSTSVWYYTCSDLLSVFSCFLTHFYP